MAATPIADRAWPLAVRTVSFSSLSACGEAEIRVLAGQRVDQLRYGISADAAQRHCRVRADLALIAAQRLGQGGNGCLGIWSDDCERAGCRILNKSGLGHSNVSHD